MSIVNTLSLESNRQIKINFDGGDLSSDAGLLLIKECLASGMPKTTWCREHGISDKSFFYWQRILREEAYLTTLESTLAPAVKENPAPTTTDFIEIKMTDQASSATSPFKPDVVIRRGAVSIEISNTATEELLNKVGGLLHA